MQTVLSTPATSNGGAITTKANHLSNEEADEEGLDLSDFFAIGGDENTVDLDDPEWSDFMNDVTLPRESESTAYDENKIEEEEEDDEEDDDDEVMGVKLPVDISQSDPLDLNEHDFDGNANNE